jgi:hypothetical protein
VLALSVLNSGAHTAVVANPAQSSPPSNIDVNPAQRVLVREHVPHSLFRMEINGEVVSEPKDFERPGILVQRSDFDVYTACLAEPSFLMKRCGCLRL